jgi:hypothetical protein
MLSGVTASALAITGMAVLRIVVSSDSIKNATATSHGNMRLMASDGVAKWAGGKKSSTEADQDKKRASYCSQRGIVAQTIRSFRWQRNTHTMI